MLRIENNFRDFFSCKIGFAQISRGIIAAYLSNYLNLFADVIGAIESRKFSKISARRKVVFLRDNDSIHAEAIASTVLLIEVRAFVSVGGGGRKRQNR